MADELDQLQAQQDMLNTLHIRAARLRYAGAGESLSECEVCGNDIPLARQKAVPGVRRCVECQRVNEMLTRLYPV